MFFLLFGIFWAKHAVYLNQNNPKFHPMFPILHRRTSDSEVTFHMFYSKCAWVDAWQPPVCLVIQLGNNLACVLGGNWPSVNINRNPETNCSKEWTTHWNKGSFKGKRYFISSVRSSSGYHGLLEGSANPLFQIFQILQIRKWKWKWKDPTCAIFLKSIGFKDIEYDIPVYQM